MPIQIDRMNESDVTAVASIDGTTRMSEDELRAEFLRPWARLWVGRETDRGVVSFLVAWHVTDELHILNVATAPDRRRRGIARALLDSVVAHARTERIKHILLEVRRSNFPAIALYRAVGFFAMGVRARYYPDDEDAIEMVLAFDVETGAILARADEVRLHG
jgi:ribosomal-protein-alanine N-acetyltransferase